MDIKTSEKPNPKKEEVKELAGKGKAAPVKEASVFEESHPQETAPTPKPEVPEVKKPLTLVSLQEELKLLKQTVSEQAQQIVEIQEQMSRKRRTTSNGRIQIRDKQSGRVYPSKNNAYQSLLLSGELKTLVDKGLFGDVPEKNNFGWFALVRAWPDRFEEVKKEAEEKASESGEDKSVPKGQ